MGEGIRLAKELGSKEAAEAIENMKDQLLIALVNRLGGKVAMECCEIDSTGSFLMTLDLKGTCFTFQTIKKQ